MTAPTPQGEAERMAYVDGRLDPARAAAVEAALAGHPEEAAALAALRQDRDALRAAFGPVAQEPLPASVAASFARTGGSVWRRVAAVAAVLVIGIGLGWAGARIGSPAGPERRDAVREAIGAHRVFVPEVRHPVEVGATEEAHLVQWLSRRIGQPLKAPDLTTKGYRLVGGRLLADAGKPAALFMYENASGQRITIHVVAETRGGPTAFRFREIDGVAAFYWIDERLSYAVIGRVTREALLEVANSVYAALEQR